MRNVFAVHVLHFTWCEPGSIKLLYKEVFGIMNNIRFFNKVIVKCVHMEKNDHTTDYNFFSVKYMRFFVSTESEFPKIFYRRLPKIAEGFQRLPKIFQWLLTITEGVERFSMTSKQGRQWFSKDFQPISSIIKECWRCSDHFSNVKKTITHFYLISF